jgi:hypothetical protein
MRTTLPLTMLILIPLLLCSCLGKRYVEYLYAHHVSGIVVDDKGNPVRDALVKKITDPAKPGEEADKMYRRVTDENGAFSFDYTGDGRKPDEEMIWTLAVIRAGFKTRVTSFPLKWVKPEAELKEPGYVLHDIRIALVPE